MKKNSRILVTGSSGVIGTALKESLVKKGYENLYCPTSEECDLVEKVECERYFKSVNPEYIFHMAGRVYGLGGNSKYKSKAIYENLMINTNVIHASHLVDAKKILAMGTVAMYPDPPISAPAKESDLWQGYPHKSEESYAIAKLAMMSTLEAYKESQGLDYAIAISTNLYGPNDRFNIDTGHVIPSLISKFYFAKQNNARVEIWGTGVAKRDFLYSMDAASGLVEVMSKASGAINLVSGKVVLIKDIVDILSRISGVDDIAWDATKPNGQLTRAYDSSKLKGIGFESKTQLSEGIQLTWDWYCKNIDKARE